MRLVMGGVPSAKGDKISEKVAFLQSLVWHAKSGWLLLHYWVRQYPVTDAAEEAEVTKHTAIDVY